MQFTAALAVLASLAASTAFALPAQINSPSAGVAPRWNYDHSKMVQIFFAEDDEFSYDDKLVRVMADVDIEVFTAIGETDGNTKSDKRTAAGDQSNGSGNGSGSESEQTITIAENTEIVFDSRHYLVAEEFEVVIIIMENNYSEGSSGSKF